jgi:isopentenyl-diphosphate delta-isomerase
VLLFDTRGRLLLQRRARAKITFPLRWTNTCCSHPLHTAAELDTADEAVGVRRAARRKLRHELGVDVPLADITYLTRILYAAPSDGVWVEREVDYVLVCVCDVAHTLAPNPNEVDAAKYVTRDELQRLFAEERASMTPWFLEIGTRFLFAWWDALLAQQQQPPFSLAPLLKFKDHTTIHRTY